MEYFIYYQDITAKLEEQGEERIQQIKENELYELARLTFCWIEAL